MSGNTYIGCHPALDAGSRERNVPSPKGFLVDLLDPRVKPEDDKREEPLS